MTDAKQLFPMHGFSFDSEEERQKVAEGHHLWPDFLKLWGRIYFENPLMNRRSDKELFEFFVAGGFAQFEYSIARATKAAKEHSAWMASEKPNDDTVDKCANCGRYPFASIADSQLQPHGSVRVCVECLGFESTEKLNELLK